MRAGATARTGQDRTGQDRTGQDRRDLCDRLEARNGLRERYRWKVLDCILEEVNDPFPTLVWFTR